MGKGRDCTVAVHNRWELLVGVIMVSGELSRKKRKPQQFSGLCSGDCRVREVAGQKWSAADTIGEGAEGQRERGGCRCMRRRKNHRPAKNLPTNKWDLPIEATPADNAILASDQTWTPSSAHPAPCDQRSQPLSQFEVTAEKNK